MHTVPAVYTSAGYLFLWLWINILTQNRRVQKFALAHSVRWQSISRQSQWQGADGQIAPIVLEQKARDGYVPLFHSIQGPPLKIMLPTYRVCLPRNLIKWGTGQPTPLLGLPSQATADFAKLTTNINQHTKGYFLIPTRSVMGCLAGSLDCDH